MKLLRPTWMVCGWCARGVGTFFLWTLWLLLLVLLGFQIYVACVREFQIPPAVLRKIERRLAESGLHIQFGAASFRPSGLVQVENAEIRSRGFEEPLVTFRALSVRLSRPLMLAGIFKPRHLRASGVRLYAPAMLSATGRNEPVLENLEISVALVDGRIAIEQFAGKLGNLAVTAHGTIDPKSFQAANQEAPGPVAQRIVQHYVRAARELVKIEAQLAHVENPVLDLAIAPNATGASLSLGLTASGARLNARDYGLAQDAHLTLGPVWANLALRVGPQAVIPARFSTRISQATWRDEATARDLVFGTEARVHREPFWIELGTVRGSMSAIEARGVAARYLTAEADASEVNWRQPRIALSTQVADAGWEIEALRPGSGTGASLHARGVITDQVVALASKHTPRNLSTLLKVPEPAHIDARVELGSDWKPASATAHVSVTNVTARNVPLDRVRGKVSYSGQQLTATDIVLAQGENHARGSYEMDTRTRAFRFLLTGALRPEGISGWFSQWWPRFWSNFDFAAAPPAADIDVQGRWGAPRSVSVFVHADGKDPVIRSVQFDRVRTTLFIRPHFYDALSLAAEREGRHARGAFTRTVDLAKNQFIALQFTVSSNLDLAESGRLFGDAGSAIVAPFRFEEPPSLVLSGRLDGPAAERGKYEDVQILVASKGPFTFYDFPLQNLSCNAQLKGDTLDIDEINVDFAGGHAAGGARLQGKKPERRLAFEADLTGIHLGEAIRTLEEFGARRKKQPLPTESRIQKRMASGKLRLLASGEGLYHDPFSFKGAGQAEITGAELGEIHLLGGLSQALSKNTLLTFTSLRLTDAKSNFTLERELLTLPDLRITGPTAAIDLKGQYALNSKLINFNAKLRPFDEGKTLFSNAVDLLLTPVSAVLELKLSGSLDQPRWHFLYGPTSFIRTITGARPDDQTPPASEPRKNAPPPLLRR